MRILTIAACPLPWPRGTPIRIHRTAEALAARGHEVHVVTYPLGDERVAIPYEVHRVGSSRERLDPRPGPSVRKLLRLDPMLVRETKRLLREEPFDVIHAHHYEGLIVALLARRATRGAPIVFDSHTLLATELPEYRSPVPRSLTRRVGRWIDRTLPPRADHVVAVTDRMRDWFATDGSIPAERVSLIPNGVEYEDFQAAARAHTPATDDTFRVTFAGNLAAYQGIPHLLDAFALVHAENSRARLEIIADAPLDPWRSRIAELGIADAVDAVSCGYAELPLRLQSADVLVNPRTDCDGLPQKLLNYMASGRPIVSFAGSAAILEHERTGWIVPDGDVAAMAAAIRRIRQDPARAAALGDAARELVAASHSWTQVAEQIERAYRCAIDLRSTGSRVAGGGGK